MTRAWLWWLAAALVAGAVAVLSSLPSPSLPAGGFWRFDKLIHASVWALLGGAIAGGGTARGWRRLTTVAVAIGIGATYGALDEWHQSFTPGRDSSLGDLLADTIGASLGAVAVSSALIWRSSAASRAGDR